MSVPNITALHAVKDFGSGLGGWEDSSLGVEGDGSDVFRDWI
jgi:hypothetical protein